MAVLITVSTALLVLNLVELRGHLGGVSGIDHQARNQIIRTGAFHILTLMAVCAIWFVLRARERDQARLRRSEQKHRTIINHAGEAIFLLDRAGRIREWNKAAETLFGEARRSVLGKALTDIPSCAGLDLGQAMEDADRLKRSLFFESPFRQVDEPDGLITMMLSPLPHDSGLDDSGERLYAVIARDVTRERQFESRMSQSEKLAGIGQLAAGIAHQLNTPLGSILLSAQMLSDANLTEDDAEDVERIIRQTEQCRQIIKGLLNFARPQSRERAAVALAEAVSETVYLMEKNLRAAGVEVDLELENDLEVVGNRNELDQVFFNLLVNAVDAMPDGGRIKIRMAPGDAGDPGEAEISFADTGSGIPAKHRDQIFLPFFTTKDYGKGTGLGLSIVARIIHEHGGRIELDETYDKGARFLLTLPRPGSGLRWNDNFSIGTPESRP